MPKPDRETGNIYRAARMEAATGNRLLANRERAAGLVYCSPEALNDYENGHTVPPCEVVQAMIETYNTPDLRGQHIRKYCPLLDGYGNEEGSHLAQAALGWAVAFGSVQDVAASFAAVARDGRITPTERAAAALIRAKATEIMQVMQETIDAIDKANGGMNK